MKLANVNIGQERTQQNGNKLETTGIYKLPTPEPVHISSLGIKEDFIASKNITADPTKPYTSTEQQTMTGGQQNWAAIYTREHLAKIWTSPNWKAHNSTLAIGC